MAELLATATKKGGPYTGNRAVSALSILYSHLEAIEAVPAGYNPARRPPRNPEQRRGEHASVRLSRDQESRLVRAIFKLISSTVTRTDRRSKTQQHSDPVGGMALLTLLDTSQQLQEVLSLE